MEGRRDYDRRGFGGAGGSSFGPKPVEVGKEYEVDITELSRRGEGIARVQGLVVFVKNTKPNDHVKVRITRISSRFAEGELAAATSQTEEEKPQEELQPEE